MAIIRSVLDTDLYKFTTSYAYSKMFPRAHGEFEFIDRGDENYPEDFADLVRNEIKSMERLSITEDEEKFLKSKLPYLPPFYIDFLKGFRFDSSEVKVEMIGTKLSVKASGLLYRITFWETPVLAIISELYFKVTGQHPDFEYMEKEAIGKAIKMREQGIVFSLFGMRRRYSFEVEDRVTEILKKYSGENFFGTSNVYLAYKHGLNVSGTHPHEWVQFHGAIYGYKMANYMAMEDWITTYDGDLGTVLTDTYTTDVFMRNFSKKHAQLFTSLRQDSGDPIVFAEKAIRRYEELRVNPKLKYIVFSDSLNVEKTIAIKEFCGEKIGATFGIGTNLTNDVGNNIKSMNIVMKLLRCKMTEKDKWHECIKLSDVEGKHTGDPKEILLAQQTLELI